jgi:catechol 2,3-dioxygenase-like lactoylglutathione lyase family enzyme
MAVRLNHTIVAAHDHEASSKFLTEILGLPPPLRLGHFAVVSVGDTSLDYMNVKEYRGADGEIVSQHYAFLVTEAEFDEIFARIRERHLPYWADPRLSQRDQINEWDGGRGVYFQDPNGHILEAITRPYGSGGSTAVRPHPLLAATREPGAGNPAQRLDNER